MNEMKKSPLLLFLLSKRLYKKISFLVILVTLVLITVFYTVAFRQESSMLKLALVSETGEKTPQVVTKLLESDGAVQYTRKSREEAHRLLEYGKVDGVLEFAPDFNRALTEFLTHETRVPPLALTIREKNSYVNLAMERVYAELYPVLAEQYYHSYALHKENFTDREALQEKLDSVIRNEDVVQLAFYNSTDKVEENNYLLTPLRGILATIMVFCSMASALYFLSDFERGNMDATPINARWWRQILYTLSGTGNIMLFVLLSLVISGLFGNVLMELPMMVLYAVACTGFATVISGITGKTPIMAALMPILTIGIMVICPIFLNTVIPYIPWLLPTYWYLTAVYNTAKIPGFLLYCLAVIGLSFLIWKNRKYTK